MTGRLSTCLIVIGVCCFARPSGAADTPPGSPAAPPSTEPPTAVAPGSEATPAATVTASSTPSAAAAAPAPPSAPARAATTGSPPPNCEPCETDKDAVEGSGVFLLGAGPFDFSSLNDHLAANGYDRLGSVMTILGGEGHAVFASGFVAGARGGVLLGPSGSGPGVRTHLSGGFGMIDLGFALVRTSHALFTFTGGIGGYGMSLGIGDDQSAPFDSVLQNPKRSVSLGHGGLLVGLTLGIDFRVPTGGVEHGRRGFFTLGARIAGLYGPPLGGWDISEGDTATDAPSAGLAGGYAALAIGFGGGSMRATNQAPAANGER